MKIIRNKLADVPGGHLQQEDFGFEWLGQTSLSCRGSMVIPNISKRKEHLTGRVVVFHLLGGLMNLCKVCSMFEYVFADASPTPERT